MKGGTYLYPALIKTCLLPPFLLYLSLRVLGLTSIRLILQVLLYLVSFPTLFIIRSHLSRISSTRRAHALGAVDIPRVKGKWVLNLDVIFDWARSGSEEEVGRMMELMKRQYGGTYNTRALGEDQVGRLPGIYQHKRLGRGLRCRVVIKSLMLGWIGHIK
jgi:hypothetical protein